MRLTADVEASKRVVIVHARDDLGRQSLFESCAALFPIQSLHGRLGVASALIGDTPRRNSKRGLATEIIASMNDDYSFWTLRLSAVKRIGDPDPSYLGVGGRQLRIAQLRLLESMQQDGTSCGDSLLLDLGDTLGRTPADFQSEDTIATAAYADTAVERELHALSLYHDVYKLISTSMAVLALAVDTSATDNVLNSPVRPPATLVISAVTMQST